MKHLLSFLFLCGLFCFNMACTKTEAQSGPGESSAEVGTMEDFIGSNVQAAEALLAAFDKKDSIQLSFSDPDRTAWNNLPINEYPRRGVALKEMSDEQKKAVHELLRAGLSDAGYLKVNWLFWNDERRREDRKKAGNPTWEFYGHNLFWVTIFGQPSTSGPWGWQLEGHHLSVNLTFQNGKVALTPLFLGADPALVPDGPFAGLQVLKVETNAAWELIQTMDKEQLEKTVISEKPFDDILTREGDEAHATKRVGISYSELTRAQRQLVLDIIEQYAGTFPEGPASVYLEKVRRAKKDLHFAWAGGTTPGEAIYYRIQGPDFLIEFDNRSGQPNHIHSVWYDLGNVFGKAH